ncbi:MAG: lipopolysaccharide heptosyltransferase II [Candidatus Binatia bacterium]
MRIIVAQTSFLGDVVLSTPVYAALRQHDPGTHVSVLVRPETAGVLAGHPSVDAVLTDDKRRRFGSVGVLRQLRAGRFDCALALHKSFRTAWLLAAAGIPQRIGFRSSAGWFFYHRCVQRDAASHDVQRNLAILAGLGVDPARCATRPFVACSPEATVRFQRLLRQRGVTPGARLVGVAPGSTWATKRWTVDGYAALINALARDEHATPILLGARGDTGYAGAIEERTGTAVINLVGQTDLGMLIAAIDACCMLVTNDSAPMHIAVARETPVVAIFGPTTPAQGYGPYTDRALVVQRELSCRPCSRHGGARCPVRTHACMTAITPAQVQAAVAQLLQDASATARRAASPP